MKLTIFQSDKGDCLLLTSQDGKRVLIDAGVAGSYREHVASELSKLPDLDLVCVSHIDDDHIGGVLAMLDDTVAWRVFDFQHARGNNRFKKPKNPKPPQIKGIWHNAFHEQMGDNAGNVESLLAAFSRILSSSDLPDATDLADFTTSQRQAMRLSRRVNAGQLNIPLNDEFGKKLVMIETAPDTVQIGKMSLSIIGPAKADLEKLKEEWNTWLAKNEKALEQIQQQAADDERKLANSLVTFLGLFDRQAEQLLLRQPEFGNRKNVTTPNLASIMFLVEENSKTILMTGDGHHADILKGLKIKNKLDTNGHIHVDVLKIQHHGSEHNTDTEFCKKVTADHYIFCGNGAHENPDLGIVDMVINSRLGTTNQKSPNSQVDKAFTVWFNSNSLASTVEKNREHMKKIEAIAGKRSQESDGHMRVNFMPQNKNFMELDL